MMTTGAARDPAAGRAEPRVATTVVLYDPDIPGAADLVAAAATADAGAPVLALAVGPQQIAADVLAAGLARAPVTVVRLCLVAHGRPGAVALGAQPLDAQVPPATLHLADTVRPFLADGAEIHLYACEAGQGLPGARLVDDLGRLTGARVAAPEGRVGAVVPGGAWALSDGCGQPVPPIFPAAARAAFPSVLIEGAPQIVSVVARIDGVPDTTITRNDVGRVFELVVTYDQPVDPGSNFGVALEPASLLDVLDRQRSAFPDAMTVVFRWEILALPPGQSQDQPAPSVQFSGAQDIDGNVSEPSTPDDTLFSVEIDRVPFVTQITTTAANGEVLTAGETGVLMLTFDQDLTYDGTGSVAVVLSNGAEVTLTAFSGTNVEVDYVVGDGGPQEADTGDTPLTVRQIRVEGTGLIASDIGQSTGIAVGDGETPPDADLPEVAVNVAPPPPSTPALAPGNDTGTSPSDGLTRLESPVVEGVTEPGSTVTVLVRPGPPGADAAAVEAGQVVAATDGSWSLQIAPGVLAEGDNSVFTRVSDGVYAPVASDEVGVSLDTMAPALTTVARAEGTSSPTSDDVLVFDLGFASAVTGFDASDLLITGGVSGTTTATITGFQVNSATSFTAIVSGGDLAGFDGRVGLALSPDADAGDGAGNAAVAALSVSESYVLDNTAPEIASIVRFAPPILMTDSDVLIFLVSFTEAVGGVLGVDFAVEGGSSADVSAVIPVMPSDGEPIVSTEYFVTLSEGDLADFNGPVGLGLSGAASITDAVGNALSLSPSETADPNEGFILDNNLPRLVSVSRSVPVGESTRADSVTFRLTFSELVFGPDVADFAVTGTAGAGTIASVAPGSASNVLLVTVDGLAGANGTVGVGLSPDNDLIDAGGNAVVEDLISNGLYAIDNAAPVIEQVLRRSPEDAVTDSNFLSFEVVFSEPVSGYAASDFSFGDLDTGVSVALVGPRSLSVRASGGELDLFNGEVGLSYAGESLISDAAGNLLAGGLPGDAETFTLVNLDPNVLLIVRGDNFDEVTSSSFVEFEIAVSEPISGFGADDLQIIGSAGVGTIGSVTLTGPTSYRVLVTGLEGGSGTLGLALAPGSDAIDADGRPLTDEVAISEQFVLDAVAPILRFVTRVDGQPDPTNADQLSFVASFDAGGALENVDPSDFVVVGSAGVGVVTAVRAIEDGETGPRFEVDVGGIAAAEGTVSIALAGDTDIQDGAGNVAVVDLDLQQFVTVENTPPTIVSVRRDGPFTERTDADQVSFLVDGSEPLLFEPTDFVATGIEGATRTVVGTEGGGVRVTFSGGTLTDFNGRVGLALNPEPSITDLAGNLLLGGLPEDAETFLIDNAGLAAAGDDALAVAEDGSLLDIAALLTANDTAGAQIVSVDTAGLVGGLGFDAETQTLDYVAAGFDALAAGDTAQTSFGYTVELSGGEEIATATVTITVTGVNDDPIAVGEIAMAGEDAGIIQNVIANDFDFDAGDVLRLSSIGAPVLVDGPAGVGPGVASIGADGLSIVFTAAGAFEALAEGDTAQVLILYTVADLEGGTAESALAVTVLGRNDAPSAQPDFRTTNEITPVTIDVVGNDIDPDAGDEPFLVGFDPASVRVTGAGPGALTTGGFSVVGGALVFDPGNDFVGLGDGQSAVVSVAYTVSDGVESDVGRAEVTVTGSAAPQLLAIRRAVPDDPVTNAPVLRFELEFDRAVTGVDAGDFTVTGLEPAPVPVVSGEGRVYSVTLDVARAVQLDSVIGLDFAPGAQIFSLDEAVVETGTEPPIDETYRSLLSDFGVVAFRRGDPDQERTDADSVTFEVAFERAVRPGTVNPDDFAVTGGSTAVVTSVVEGESGFLVSVAGGDLASFNGPLGLDLRPGSDITDIAGNRIDGQQPGIDQTYELVNGDGPRVLSIARPEGTAELARGGTLVWQVVFDRPVRTGEDPDQVVDGSDFVLDGPAGATIEVTGTGAVRTVTLTGEALEAFDGPVGLGFADDARFLGVNGAGFLGLPPLLAEGYLLDNTGPSLTAVRRAEGAPAATAEDRLDFVLTFDQAVVGLQAEDILVTGPAGATVAVAGTGTAATVSLSGPSIANFDGTVGVGLAPGATVTDAPGNPLENAVPGVVETYLLDNTGPTLVSITRAGGAPELAGPGVLSFRVAFDEPVFGVDAGDFSVRGATAQIGVSTVGNGSAAVVTLSNVDIGPALTAQVGIGLSGQASISDALGNAIEGGPTGASEIYTVQAGLVVAESLTLEIAEDAAVANLLGGLITLPEGAQLIGVGTAGTVGMVNFAGPGSALGYVATGFDALAAGVTGTDSFTYTVATADGTQQATGLVTVNVTGVNDAPAPVAISGQTTASQGLVLPVALSAADPDGPAPVRVGAVLSVSVEGAGLGGLGTATLAPTADGAGLAFSPGADFAGIGAGQSATVRAIYSVVDGAGAQGTATATIVVTGEGTPPTAVDDRASTTKTAPVTVPVLANDTDPDMGPSGTLSLRSIDGISVEGAAGTGVGALSAEISGSGILVSPNGRFDALSEGQTATVRVAYTVEDGDGLTASAQAIVTVTGLDAAPVANDDAASVQVGSLLIGDVLANDFDIEDGDRLQVVSFAQNRDAGTRLNLPNFGKLTIREDGNFVFEPTVSLGPNQSVSRSVGYVIEDMAGNSDAGVLTVTVNGSNVGAVEIEEGSSVRGVNREGDASDNVLLGGIGNDLLAGGDGDDTINGGLGRDTLYGERGNDLIDGQADADLIFGGGGNDDLLGDLGNDKIFGEDGDDRIRGGAGNDGLAGGEGRDTISGGAGNDDLIGGAGNDVLEGGSGDDGLLGGQGADVIVLTPGSGSDVMADFQTDRSGPVSDTIRFVGFSTLVDRGGPEGAEDEALALFRDTADGSGVRATIEGTTILLLDVFEEDLSVSDFDVI